MRWVVLFLLFFSFPLVHGLALSHEYLEGNVLRLSPGENKYFKLIIQNEQDSPTTITVNVTSDVAQLVGDPLLELAPKTYDNFVYFNITIPEDAQENTTYRVDYVVQSIDEVDGQVPFSVKYERNIKIHVVEGQAPTTEQPADIANVERSPPEERSLLNSGILTAILGVLVLGLLVFLWQKSTLLTKKKKPIKKESVEITEKHEEKAILTPAPKQSEWDTPVTTEQQAEEPSLQEQLHHTKAPPGKEFHLETGQKLGGLADLKAALATMDHSTFQHHVNDHKNDFSVWIGDALEAPAIAEMLSGAQTPEEMQRVLDELA